MESSIVVKNTDGPSKDEPSADGTVFQKRSNPTNDQISEKVSLAHRRQQSRVTDKTKTGFAAGGTCDSGQLTSPREMRALQESLCETDMVNQTAIDKFFINKPTKDNSGQDS